MESILALAVAGALVVAVAAALGPRLRIPAPLLLVVVGIALSLLPFTRPVQIDPQVVLLVVLPPLLYASSVSLPTMDLRREFGAVSGLSVVLVLLTSLALGGLLALVVPGIGYVWAFALAAVISPTDAVATSIVKGTGVSHRVTAILEGESLLNDASALVLLRSASTAGLAGAGLSAAGIVGGFLFSVVVAVVVGVLVGLVSVRVRQRVGDAAVGTLLSFAVPFVASLPAEALGASGLVAAVAAGLAVGRSAPRRLSPQQRISDEQNWRTVSLALEGAVFLLMGLQIQAIVDDAGADRLAPAVGLGALAVAATLVLRTVYVAPLLWSLRLRSRRGIAFREQLERWQQQVAEGRVEVPTRLPRARPRTLTGRQLDRFSQRVQQGLADIDYLAARPLGVKEGAVVVWAGMRGAVTVAAAQTLPNGTPQRPLLVLIAFAAAAISLLLQGGTLSVLIRVLKPAGQDPEQLADERQRILELLKSISDAQPPQGEGESPPEFRLRHLRAQRDALLDARDQGIFDSDTLAVALASVDASEIAMETSSEFRG